MRKQRRSMLQPHRDQRNNGCWRWNTQRFLSLIRRQSRINGLNWSILMDSKAANHGAVTHVPARLMRARGAQFLRRIRRGRRCWQTRVGAAFCFGCPYNE